MNKTLFIFSDDFGELVLLRLLLYKQPIHVYLALPERLYDHVTLPNVTKFLYRNAQELHTYINDIQPEQVMLFSGYLLVPNGMLSNKEFYSLLDSLDKKEIPVVTSDPFMRIYDYRTYESEGVSYLSRIRNRFKTISERLKTYKHVYGVPVELKDTPCQSFSNTNKPFPQGVKTEKKQWTFVLAKEDYHLIQSGNNGRYHHTLIPLFKSLTENHDIQINLIFPKDLIEVLQVHLKDCTSINYVKYCHLNAFEELIIQSDVMLYWNIFSASTLLCRLHNKPIVFLGQGHMATIFPDFYAHVKSGWFPDKEPEIMSLDDSFIPKILELLKEDINPNSSLYYPYYTLDEPQTIFSTNTTLV